MSLRRLASAASFRASTANRSLGTQQQQQQQRRTVVTAFAGSEAAFKSEILEKNDLVLVDFYTEWCGPCKAFAPAFDKISEDPKYKDKVKFLKINVEESEELGLKFDVRSIPTFIALKKGPAGPGQLITQAVLGPKEDQVVQLAESLVN